MRKICQYCERAYGAPPSIKPKYCSHKCASLAKKKGKDVPCAQCGKLFYKYPCKPDRLYCSMSCAITARNLTDANPSKHRDLSGKNNPMYGKGHLITGENNPMWGRKREKNARWNGGRKIRKDGYILIMVSEDHPYQFSFDPERTFKYMLEHRAVMEVKLGRRLEPTEVVHHIDGNPSNNAIENLQLFSSQGEHISLGHSA